MSSVIRFSNCSRIIASDLFLKLRDVIKRPAACIGMSLGLIREIFESDSETAYDPLTCSLEMCQVLELMDKLTGYHWTWCLDDLCFKSYDISGLTELVSTSSGIRVGPTTSSLIEDMLSS